MRKVFLVIKEDVYDSDKNTTHKVFGSQEQANAYYQQELKSAKKTAEEESWEEEETETSYSAYNEGYYVSDHIDLWIEEHDVIGTEDTPAPNTDAPITVSDLQKLYTEKSDGVTDMIDALEKFVNTAPNKAIRFNGERGNEVKEYTGLRCDASGVLKVIVDEEYEIDAEELGFDEVFELYERIWEDGFSTDCDYSWLDD